jgi:hypothetical protein
MADQNRNQQNREKGTQQSAPPRDRDRVAHQTQGSEKTTSSRQSDESIEDADTRGMGQTDRERTNREPAAVANDSGLGNRSARRFDGDQQDELGVERDPDLALDEGEELLDDTGRRDR